ncbi:MAG: Nitroreductase [candidate division TM6 bacterium GW2011_GWF2_37_49]|nr:MAG: Nitroreductase [candidate division TM6 bacterium GW2011_GWF2_37_49]
MPRKALYPISNIFINRWSSRAMSDQPVTNEQLMTLFEAARWAPSGYNEQPWRFIYTYKNTKLWNELIALMIPFNQSWAKNSAVLVVIISKNFFDRTGKPSHLHTFDAGAAWMSLALQGSISGLVIHAIGDFDYDAAKTILDIPDEFKIEVMVAIGNKGKKEILAPELQAREVPNDRKPLSEIVFENKFKE